MGFRTSKIPASDALTFEVIRARIPGVNLKQPYHLWLLSF